MKISSGMITASRKWSAKQKRQDRAHPDRGTLWEAKNYVLLEDYFSKHNPVSPGISAKWSATDTTAPRGIHRPPVYLRRTRRGDDRNSIWLARLEIEETTRGLRRWFRGSGNELAFSSPRPEKVILRAILCSSIEFSLESDRFRFKARAAPKVPSSSRGFSVPARRMREGERERWGSSWAASDDDDCD